MSIRWSVDHEIESVITRIRAEYLINFAKNGFHYLLKSINLLILFNKINKLYAVSVCGAISLYSVIRYIFDDMLPILCVI